MDARAGLVGWWLLGAACVGKEDVSDTGEGDADTDADADTDTDTDADTDSGTDPLGCADDEAPSEAPLQLTGSTLDQLDDGGGSCGGGGGADYVYLYTAPADGDYVLDTVGSAYDALLAVFETCGGNELGCDDDSAGDLQARVRVTLAAGQQVLLWVDSYGLESGDFVINLLQAVSAETSCTDQQDEDADGLFDCLDPDCAGDSSCEPVCPDETVTTEPYLLEGSTVGLTSEQESYCGEPFVVDSDYSAAFVAPVDGRYRFALDMDETDFEATLSLYQTCGGWEMGCEADADPELVRDLLAGEEVVVVVDGVEGSAGDFSLLMEKVDDVELDCADGDDNDYDWRVDCRDTDCDLDPGCPETCGDGNDNDGDYWIDCADGGCAEAPECDVPCPERALVDVAEGSTLGLGNEWEGSCTSFTSSEITYEFVAPADGDYLFSTAGSTYDTLLYVLDGCGGVELGCQDDTAYDQTSEVQVSLVADQVVIVVVDGFEYSSGEYVLTVTAL